jgi:hypothetical protein
VRPRLIAALRRLRPHLPELALAVAVAAFAISYRVVHLEPLEIGGDALNKWHFARQWFHRFDITQVRWDHHLTRFGVNLPLGLLQLFIGRAAIGYHVAALIASTAVALLVYAIGRLSHGRTVGVIAAVWCVVFPSWERAGSQVTPDSFGAAWVALGMVCLLLYADRARPKLGWLVASAVSLFLAYLAKEPLVFFIPGAVLATFLLTRRWKHAALYAAIPLGLLVVETLFYRAVSDFSSRFSIVSSTHGSGLSGVNSFWSIFERYADLGSAWNWLLALSLAGALLVPVLRADRRNFVVICLPVSFFFFYTFSIRSLNPLRMWTRFIPRYLDPGVPFCALLASLFLVVLAERLFRLLGERALGAAERMRRFEPWVLSCGVACLAVVVYAREPPSQKHPLRLTPRYTSVLTDAYRRGIPILSKGDEKMGRKALRAAFMAYIDDRELLIDGALPRFGEVHESGRVMVRSGAPPRPEGCFVRVWARDRFLMVDPKTMPPKDCD